MMEDEIKYSNLTSQSPFRLTFSKLMKKKLAVISMIILLVLYMSGIFASFISPYPYTETDLINTQESPTKEHILGTDSGCQYGFNFWIFPRKN